MRKATKPTVSETSLPSRTFILDNGAHTIKAGFAPEWPSSDVDTLRRCHNIPNSLVRTRDKRTYVAREQETITQWNEAVFRRPVGRGQLVNWESQKEIWDQTFFNKDTAVSDLWIEDPATTTLLFTEPPNTIQALQRNADEIIMEEWGFGGYARRIGPSLNAYNNLNAVFGDFTPVEDSFSEVQPRECLLVIDSGYSHTTITPLYNGLPIQRAIRRLDIGGKHMTNLLKDVISLRHFDLRQDTKIVNDIKEDVCFVSTDFNKDMERARKGQLQQKGISSQRSLKSFSAENKENRRSKEDQEDKEAYVKSNNEDGDEHGDEASVFIDYVLPNSAKIKRGFARPHDPQGRIRRQRQRQKMVFPTDKAAAKTTPKHDISDEDEDGDLLSMTLSTERFTIPELLFHPSDHIRSPQQPGISQVALQSLSVLPPALQPAFLSNILLVGGNANIPGFAQRLQDEICALTPTSYNSGDFSPISAASGGSALSIPSQSSSLTSLVRVRTPRIHVAQTDGTNSVKPIDPTLSIWLGGARLAAASTYNSSSSSSSDSYAKSRASEKRGGTGSPLSKMAITKEEYYEYGSAWVGRKFASLGSVVGPGGLTGT